MCLIEKYLFTRVSNLRIVCILYIYKKWMGGGCNRINVKKSSAASYEILISIIFLPLRISPNSQLKRRSHKKRKGLTRYCLIFLLHISLTHTVIFVQPRVIFIYKFCRFGFKAIKVSNALLWKIYWFALFYHKLMIISSSDPIDWTGFRKTHVL